MYSNFFRRPMRAICVVLFALSGLGANAASVQIDFDGLSAPCIFGNTTPLTNQYAAFGVHFSGIGGNSGSVLNQCGNFGFNAFSGTDFWAWNNSPAPASSNAFQLDFDQDIVSYSIYVALSPVSLDGVYVRANDANGALIVQDAIKITPAWGWTQLSLAGTGIRQVQMYLAPESIGAFDNLQFTPATTGNPLPLPSAIWLLAAGAALLSAQRRAR